MTTKNTKKKATPKQEVNIEKQEVRKIVEAQIEQKTITSSAVDFATLKRMYPKRFLSEIVKTEGYIQQGNKYIKQ